MEPTEAPQPTSDVPRSKERLPGGTERIIALTDIGRNADDMIAFALAGALRDEVDLQGVITTLVPAQKRAQTVRYTLDNLGLQHVPASVGTDIPYSGSEKKDQQYQFTHLPPNQPEIQEKGTDVLDRLLRDADDKSLTILGIAGLTDLATYLTNNENRDLFTRKVKKVVIMGGVGTKQNGELDVDEQTGYLKPDSSANYGYDSTAATDVFRVLQKSDIPMHLVSRHAAAATSLPKALFDQMEQTGNPIGAWIKDAEQKGLASLFLRCRLPIRDPRRGELPDRCDEAWFRSNFCSGNDTSKITIPIEEGENYFNILDDADFINNVWEKIGAIPPGDPLALIVCSPALVERFFTPTMYEVNGVRHMVYGVSKDQRGIKDAEGLKNFLSEKLLEALKPNTH